MRRFFPAGILIMAALAPRFAFPQTGQSASMNEKFIRLEEGQKAIGTRIDDTNKRMDDTNRRIDDLRTDMGNRFDDLRFWLGLIATTVFAVLGGLFGLWLYLIRNLRQPTSGVNGRPVNEQRSADMEEVQKRIAALEAQLKQLQPGPV